jgi:hypothetical protein
MTFLGTRGEAQMRGRSQRPPSIPPHLVMERLSRMSPKEREDLLGRLPNQRRALIEERLKNYSRMPETAKKRLRDEYDFFQQLPPEKQDEMRTLFRRLGGFPQDRRSALRREIVRLRNLPHEQRAERMNSDSFREEFSEGEREFLGELTRLFTHPAPVN